MINNIMKKSSSFVCTSIYYENNMIFWEGCLHEGHMLLLTKLCELKICKFVHIFELGRS